MNLYPMLEIDIHSLRGNAEYVYNKCKAKGIEITGVVKGANAIYKCAEAMVEGGITSLASSRIEQLRALREGGFQGPLLMLRIPMESECQELVKLADISLCSQIETIRHLEKAAEAAGVCHEIVLMKDLGDLREGFWKEDDLIEAAKVVEASKHLYLKGVGTNLGCYGSVLATADKLQELVDIARRVEAAIGRPLQWISGGASSSFMRVLDGDIPEGVNHLRMGEHILLARDLDVFYGYDVSPMSQKVFTLKAQVIEVETKPTHPIGELAVDAFGRKPKYIDRGIRRRAILAFGKVDVGGFNEVFPRMEGVEILGGSSDHAILDVEDAKEEIKVGDILEFDIDYVSLVYLTGSRNVKLSFVEKGL